MSESIPSKRGSLRVKPRDIGESLGKLPPQALDLEEAVLGVCMLERGAQVVALEKLTPDDFYKDAHKEIFNAIVQLANDGQGIDMRTVRAKLSQLGKLELVGGTFILADLTARVSSGANVEFYCHVIIEKRMARDMIEIASLIHHEAYEDTTDVFDLLKRIAEFPSQIFDKIKSGGERHIRDGIVSRAESINKRTEDQPEITGVPTGYNSLDKLTLGWQKTDLILIAARPSMGKTTFVVNVARNAAVTFKTPVAIFSLEMSFQQLSDKLIASESDIELKKLTSQVFTQLDMDRFFHTTIQLSNAPIYIDDKASLSITDFRIRARRMVEKYKVQMIIVDYLQLMKGEHHIKNREQEISSISRGLKHVAKELNIPVIALSQLSRQVEDRPTKLPQLSDLRESGSLEQDADVVGFLYRPAYYKFTGDERGTFVDGLTKIIIAKHRNGEVGEAFVAMRGKTSKFINIDSPYTHLQTAAPTGSNLFPPPAPTTVPPIDNDDLPF
jgi:replicative DNA helicase